MSSPRASVEHPKTAGAEAGDNTIIAPAEQEASVNHAVMLEDKEATRTLLDTLHEGVYYVDTEMRIQYWNKAAERISGYSSAEALGKRCADNVLCHIDQDGNSMCHRTLSAGGHDCRWHAS